MQAIIYKYLEKGHTRTIQIKKNIFITFLLKGGSVLITFLLVPLTINYINPVQYGLWLTISSMIYWISVFDIGIGNGLKNEIAYSIAIKDEGHIKKYISTSYAVLTIISLGIFTIFFSISYYLDWNKIFNISYKENINIYPILLIFVGYLCLQFVLQLIDAIISAVQKVFISSVILFTSQLVGLISIYILTLFVPGSLYLLVVVMAGSSLVVIILASLYLYKTNLKAYSPSYKYVDFTCLSKILNIGGSFFIIQVFSIILVHTNNFLVLKILGPEAVTMYYIPFRLFSFISMLFTIIIMPYWSAFTNAYATKDLFWIKENIKKLRLVWLILSMGGIIVFIFSDLLYKLWISSELKIPIYLSLAMLLYVMVYSWQTLHVYFLNGVGKIRLQLYTIIIGATFNIPLSVCLGKKYGITGIVSANTIIFLLMSIIFTFQYTKIINEKSTKIWDK
ncbi:lipopolysaccharide biosynthesis protein [Spirosoma flavum]|uniref:Lipopolysaccharide biosynthesis protein n=1 Tax=Spirosoma flavum TaxID=2048557 RepID=A0ABW6ARK1_9BACT